MKAADVQGNRGGFALAMVVFLLFAVAVAGATGYQVVSSEFTLARQNRDGQEALAAARGGLQRFLGEVVGRMPDTVRYDLTAGGSPRATTVTVTAKRVLRQDSLNELYYVRSEATVQDPRTPLLPARRTVGTYAWYRMSPIRLKGAMWVSGGTTRLRGSFWATTSVSGFDDATAAMCAGGGTAGVRGAVKGSGAVTVDPGESLTGPAPSTVTYSGFSAFRDTVRARWDILANPSFPVDFRNAYPAFGSLPADSFPIVRFEGNHTTPSLSGRGVLIVTGQLTLSSFFSWDGIILAGELRNVGSFSYPYVRGMLIAGLNAANPNVDIRGDIRYHSCNAYKANRALSYLEVVDNTMFEVNR